MKIVGIVGTLKYGRQWWPSYEVRMRVTEKSFRRTMRKCFGKDILECRKN